MNTVIDQLLTQLIVLFYSNKPTKLARSIKIVESLDESTFRQLHQYVLDTFVGMILSAESREVTFGILMIDRADDGDLGALSAIHSLLKGQGEDRGIVCGCCSSL